MACGPKGYAISIHALLAESDRLTVRHSGRLLDFYPRSPCGERPSLCFFWCRFFHFYPRSPCGERPAKNRSARSNRNFYPRSPCGERLETIIILPKQLDYFYPRSPCGERLWPGLLARPFFIISIHALLAESDIIDIVNNIIDRIFLSTLSLRRATKTSFLFRLPKKFLSTLSLRRATRL